MSNSRQSYENLYQIQNHFDSLSENDILTISSYINNSVISIDRVFTLFKIQSQIRPKKFELICEIISLFNSNLLEKFIKEIEKELQSINYQLKDNILTNSWLFRLISFLFSKNKLSNETIRLFHSIVSNIKNRDCLFLYSTSLLAYSNFENEQNKDLYDLLINVFNEGPFSYKTFMQYTFLYSMEKEQTLPTLYSLIRYQAIENSLTYAIIYDVTDILIDFSSKPNFYNFDLKMERCGYETKFFYEMPSLLCGTCFYDSISCFKYLILNKTPISNIASTITKENEFGNKISRYAIAGGNLEIIRILSQIGIDFSLDIDIAAKYHQYDIFRWIIETNSPDEDTLELQIKNVAKDSVSAYNLPILEFLFSEFSDYLLDIIKSSFFYCVSSNEVEILCLLSDILKTLPKTTQEEIFAQAQKENYLIYSADHNNCQMMKLLIDLNICNVNDQDQIGETALHKCVIHRFIEGINFLLSFPNINPNIQSNSLTTPLHHAARLGFPDIVDLLLENYIIKPDLTDKSSMTPFLYSITSQSIETIQLFLERKDIDFNHYNKDNQNALKLAEQTNNQDIINIIKTKLG